MKEYEVIDGRKYLLKGTTARVEQALAELGLSSEFVTIYDNPEVENKNPDLVLQELLKEGGEKLVLLCNIIFKQPDFKKEDAIDIDKSQVREAIMDFFMRDLVLMGKYLDFSKNLVSQK